MFDNPRPASALHRFADTRQEAIQNAALLLGGPAWLRRAQRLLDDLSQPAPLTWRIIREARELLALLALENVHDMERVEAACFAALDPMAPYAEETCLLHDALAEAIRELGPEPTAPARTAMEAQADE